jgi:acetoin utilization protein AcuB
MSKPVISVDPETPITDALAMFREKRIRRAPVMKGSEMIGIVSLTDLLNASPSAATSLSIFELHYLISKVKAKDVMTKEVVTVGRDTPIEEAARLMVDKKIGGLPVVDGKKVVGIITETDLFKVFMELMGARDGGLRVTARVLDKPGALEKVTKAIAEAGGNFISFGFFQGEDATTKTLTFKVEGIKEADIKKVLGGAVQEFQDVRQT